MEGNIALYFWSLNDTMLNDFFKVLSNKIYIITTCLPFIIYALFRFKQKSITFLIAVIVAVSVSDILCHRVLKPTIKRLRPAYELKLSENENPKASQKYSMPSNHASNIFAFFTVYFFYVRKYWILLFTNSVLIALSRIILVKHYVTDVLAGIAIGTIIALFVIFLFSFLKKTRILSEKNY